MSGITLADVRPGDIVFGPIGGFVPGWFPVAVGQMMLADRTARLTWRRWRKMRHVLVVTQASQFAEIGKPVSDSLPRAMQAMPRGAEEIELTEARHWTSEYVFVRPNYPAGYLAHYGDGQDIPAERFGQAVASKARSYIGTPYGFLTYAALVAEHLLPGRQQWLADYISSRKEMICSQLADQAMSDAGFHVFDDGRLPQDVVPAELFRALIDMPGTRTAIPGVPGWIEPLRP